MPLSDDPTGPDGNRDSLAGHDDPIIAQLRAAQRKRVAAIRKLNARYAGQAFPKRAAERWNRLRRELYETGELITELRARCEQQHRAA